MRPIAILLLLMISTPVFAASSGEPTLLEVIDGAKSIFHGKVISGRIESESFVFEEKELENQFGYYTVEVIKHIAGAQLRGNIRVTTKFPAVRVGSYNYPAPGLEYIFITDTAQEPLEFSPYHLPRIIWNQRKQLVVDIHHSFVKGVNFYYRPEEDWELKKDNLLSIWDADEIHPHVRNFVGYESEDYFLYIDKHYKPNNTSP